MAIRLYNVTHPFRTEKHNQGQLRCFSLLDVVISWYFPIICDIFHGMALRVKHKPLMWSRQGNTSQRRAPLCRCAPATLFLRFFVCFSSVFCVSFSQRSLFGNGGCRLVTDNKLCNQRSLVLCFCLHHALAEGPSITSIPLSIPRLIMM